MDSRKVRKRTQILTLVGSILFIVPVGVDCFWGSVSVYALSFVVSRLDSNSESYTPLTISLYLMFYDVSVLASGLMARYVRRRTTVILGSALVNGAFCLSYFAIQNSLVMLNLLLGVFTGCGSGLLYGSLAGMILQTADENEGFLCAFFSTAYPIGGLVIPQIATWYVNPQNLIPELRLGAIDYFTQKSVIDKIPSMFLVIGGFSIALHVIGFLLLQANPNVSSVSRCYFTSLEEHTLIQENGEPPNKNSIANSNHQNKELSLPDTSPETSTKDSGERTTAKDFTPGEILKSPAFYAIWFSFFLADFSYIIFNNFYKLFGQVWIHDDHFLTHLGTGGMVVNLLTRASCAVVISRIEPKLGLMSLTGICGLSMSWYCFTAMVNRWLYGFATLVLGGQSGGMYAYYMAAIALIFGKRHYATNVGIFLTSSMVANIAVPFITDVILSHFGWLLLFNGAGALNIIGVVACLIFV